MTEHIEYRVNRHGNVHRYRAYSPRLGGHTCDNRANGLTCRPVVVIDPENREEVQRIIDTLRSYNGQGSATLMDRWQLALREFASSKLDEPTGLGAVVEDADGVRYVRVLSEGDLLVWTKMPADEFTVHCFGWDEFTAVRVLSEGVKA